MGDLQFQFNAQGIEPKYGGAGGGLPVGKHMVVLSSAEWSPTKDGSGNMLVLTSTAVDGPAKGQSQIDRLNLQNPNPQASAIAQRQLAAYCAVTGHPQGIAQAMSEIFNAPFIQEIALQKGEEAQRKGYTEVAAIYFADGRTPDGKMPGGGGVQQMPQAPQPGNFQPQPGPGPQVGGFPPQTGPGPQTGGFPQQGQQGAFPPNNGGGFPGAGPQSGPQGGGFPGGAPQGGFPNAPGPGPGPQIGGFPPGGQAPWLRQ